MTRWEARAIHGAALGYSERYTVVKVSDGKEEEVRARWSRLSCIDAQVIAEELNNAHKLGRIEAIEAMRAQVFED